MDDAVKRNIIEQPKEVAIHATAIIENSLYAGFCQDELDSIVRFITNNEHLKKSEVLQSYNESAG